MSKYIVHVNRHFIAANSKDGGTRPIYSVKEGNKKVRYAREVLIDGPSRFVYDGTRLKCGAVAWLESNGPITLIDEMDFQEAKNVV